MAKFVEKTFHSINSVINNSGIFQNKQPTKLAFQWNLDVDTFTNRLRCIDSKQEEEDIITMYLTAMEKRLAEPDVSNVEIDTMVKLCMICETLGYSASFIYIHSLKLAQKGNLQEKHTGYLAASYFLNPKHELVILLINTMQKDLCSSNYVEVLLALTSVCNLITSDTVHNVMHLVGEKLSHKKSSVRKLAILTLSHCLRIANSQSAYQISFPKLEKALTDPELEVVSVAVRIINNAIQHFPIDSSYLVGSLLELQEQVLLRRIPSNMNYSDMPAPWLQIDILKLLSFLCKNIENSRKIAPVLKKTLQQVGLNHTLAHAVVYQVIETATSVPLCSELSECVLLSISMFLKSKDVNLKFMGIESLVLMMKKLKPSISSDQQEIIMECLKLPDEMLQLKTLELLYQLANPSNFQPICKKMVQFLLSVEDVSKKKELAEKILHLASKYSNHHNWYVSTVNTVFLEAGCLLLPNYVENVINLVEKDNTLKEIFKAFYIDCIERKNQMSSCSTKVFLSVLSNPSELIKYLPSLMIQADEDLLNWIFTFLIETTLKSKEDATQKNLSEALKLSNGNKEVLVKLAEILNVISEFKNFDPDTDVDPSLTFLDGFVLDSLQKTPKCYLPLSVRLPSTSHFSVLKFENISSSAAGSEISCTQNSEKSSGPKSPTYNAFSSPSVSFQSLLSEKEYFLPSHSKKSAAVWTEEGRKPLPDEDDSSLDGDINNSKEEEADSDQHELFAGVL